MPSSNLEHLRSFVMNSVLDAAPVADEVEWYRNHWKPRHVTTLLLAESHVHTSADDFRHMWTYKNLGGHFVRFVYCLGYGENELFVEHPTNNEQGTRPYWEIFCACVSDVESNDDFGLLRKSTDKEHRMEGKIRLLENLRDHEIWLADASPVAIDTLKSEVKKEVMREAWNCYTGSLVEQLAKDGLKRVVIIGKTVEGAIGKNVERLGLRIHVIPQPSRYTPKSQRWKSFSQYYEICNAS